MASTGSMYWPGGSIFRGKDADGYPTVRMSKEWASLCFLLLRALQTPMNCSELVLHLRHVEKWDIKLDAINQALDILWKCGLIEYDLTRKHYCWAGSCR